MLHELIASYDVDIMVNNNDGVRRIELYWWGDDGSYNDEWFHFNSRDPFPAVYAAFKWHLEQQRGRAA